MKKAIAIIVLALLVSNIGFAEKNVRSSGGTPEDFSAEQTLSESELNDLRIKAENNDINSQIELYYYYICFYYYYYYFLFFCDSTQNKQTGCQALFQ